ncbi:hypothetical protein [Lacipirellula sp.]|uniref:hypothetical protein n=1 Tax=Lacipirellula sp. TaxID=2691419 RepID=UPI003D10D827
MQFYTTSYDPTPLATLVCRQQRWGLLVFVAVFCGIPFVWHRLEAPGIVTYGTALLALLICPVMLRSWRKRGRRDNWAIALDGNGVWLNLRDCEYHNAEPGETIVYLANRELLSARRFDYRYTTPNQRKHSTQHREVYLELQVDEATAAEIKQRVDAEQRREMPPHRALGGLLQTRVSRNSALVRVHNTSTLRILFSSSTYRLTPGLKRLLSELARDVPVDDAPAIRSEPWQELSPAECDELIRSLASQGRLIEATQLAQATKKISLTAARELVDSLSL